MKIQETKTLFPNLESELKKLCRENKVRPQISIQEKPLQFRNNKFGHFIMVSYYWNENYMDKLSFNLTKWKDLINNTIAHLSKQDKVTKVEPGLSDGHLFFILTLNL